MLTVLLWCILYIVGRYAAAIDIYVEFIFKEYSLAHINNVV